MKTIFVNVLTLVYLLSLISCEEDNATPKNQQNTDPQAPVLMQPENFEIDVGMNISLYWQVSTDPDFGDKISYDVLFGTNPNPNLIVSSRQTTTSYALHNLKFNTSYYWKIIACDENGGSASSPVWTFTTTLQGSFTDPRDGKTYKIVQIGKQIWMAENLAYMPHVSPSDVEGGIWVYGYEGSDVNAAKNTSNYQNYGCLYNYTSALIVIPDGWHFPTDEEWKQLEMYLGMSQSTADITGLRGNSEGGELKETGYTYWQNPNTEASDKFGFSARPAGMRSTNKTYSNKGMQAYFWTKSEYNAFNVWYRILHYDNAQISRLHTSKSSGFAVRCVKN